MKRMLIAAALFLAGCSTLNVTKTPWIVQANKEEGRVRVGYWDGRWEVVSADWEGGARNALDECRDWGFSAVEPMGEVIRVCTKSHPDGYGGQVCDEYDIYRDFRCLN